VDEAVERGEQGHAPLDRRVEQDRIDPPGPPDAVDDRLLARGADVDRFDLLRRAVGASDAQGGEAPGAAASQGLVERYRRLVGVDALGEVPEPFPCRAAAGAAASRDRDHAHEGEQLEHLGHVLVVRPAGRAPWADAGVGKLAGEQRAVGPQPLEDVEPAGTVVRDPRRTSPLPARSLGAAPLRHLRAKQGEVLHGPQDPAQLDDALFLEGLAQGPRVVGGAHAAPQDEVGARGDRCRRVELD